MTWRLGVKPLRIANPLYQKTRSYAKQKSHLSDSKRNQLSVVYEPPPMYGGHY
jgi:hypothetical protein